MDREVGIFTAAELGLKDRLAKMVTAKNVDSKGPFGRTCLMLAAMANQLAIVEALLKAGANVKLQCQLGMTALDWAVRLQQQQCRQLLTSHGATETPELKIKIDSVVRTVELGSVEDLEIALITTPEETSKRTIHKRSLLHIAALLGRVDHWKVLIDRLNPNEKDELSYTPLNYIQTNPLNHLFRILQLSPTTHRQLEAASKSFDPLQNHFDIVIVGAGAAGIAAARYLQEHTNKSYVVLEARNRPCGRVYGEPVGGVEQDFGASWIHNYSKDNPFHELIRRFNWPLEKGVNRPVQWFDADSKDCKFDSDMHFEAQNLYGTMVENGKLKAHKTKQTVSVWDSIKEQYEKWIEKGSDLERYVFYCMFWTEHYEAASIRQLDVFYDRYGGATGGDAVPLPSYYHLLRKLSEGLNIRLEQVVQQIDYADSKIRIKLKDNTEVTANKTIVTLPLGILKTDKVRFVPPLPQRHCQAISKLGFGLMNKIFLEYDKKFWKGQIRIINGVNGKIAWLYDRSTAERFVLMCFVTADYAKSLTDCSEEFAVAEADGVLRKIYGERCGRLLGGRATKWQLEQYSLGSYSHFGVGSSDEDCQELAKPICSRLYFAGEHVYGQHIGTAYGAYITGLQAAQFCQK